MWLGVSNRPRPQPPAVPSRAQRDCTALYAKERESPLENVEQRDIKAPQSDIFLAASANSKAVKPMSEAVTVRTDLDLAKVILVFSLAAVWSQPGLLKNQCFESKVYTCVIIKWSQWQWVLSDKGFNSLQHLVNFLFLLQGWVLFVFILLGDFGWVFPPSPPQSGFSALLLCELLSVLLINE